MVLQNTAILVDPPPGFSNAWCSKSLPSWSTHLQASPMHGGPKHCHLGRPTSRLLQCMVLQNTAILVNPPPGFSNAWCSKPKHCHLGRPTSRLLQCIVLQNTAILGSTHLQASPMHGAPKHCHLGTTHLQASPMHGAPKHCHLGQPTSRLLQCMVLQNTAILVNPPPGFSNAWWAFLRPFFSLTKIRESNLP